MTTLSVPGHDGHALAVHERDGTGIPLLFMSGLLVPADIWLPLLHLLPQRRCLLMDFRGQGGSGTIPDRTPIVTFGTHLLDVLSVIECLVPDRCHVVGLSMGGMIGIEWALHRPKAIASLSLISTSADGELPENLPAFQAMVQDIESNGITTPFCEAVLSLYLSESANADKSPTGPRARLNEFVISAHPHSIAALCRGMFDRPSRMAVLDRLTIPVQSLVCTSDRIISLERQRRTVQGISGCRSVDVDACGHIPPLENPSLTAMHLNSFVTHVEAAFH